MVRWADDAALLFFSPGRCCFGAGWAGWGFRGWTDAGEVAVEVVLKRIDVPGPEAAEGSQPGIDLLEGLGTEAVEAALRVDGGFDEAGLAEHAQVLGDGGLGHAKPALDFADGLMGGEQEAEDGAAVGFGDDLEGGFHTPYIPQSVYTCQGI